MLYPRPSITFERYTCVWSGGVGPTEYVTFAWLYVLYTEPVSGLLERMYSTPAIQVWDDLWDHSTDRSDIVSTTRSGSAKCLHAIGRFVLIMAELTSIKRIKQGGDHGWRL
jgi:hypothetical protein